MSKSEFPLVGGGYRARSMVLDAQRLVNMYVVLDETGKGKVARGLYGCPGKRLLATLPGSGGIRAEHPPTDGGNAIVVRGSSVYRVAADWTYTFVGNVDTETTPVDIADDGIRAMLVTGPNGYFLNLTTNVLTQITDPAFYGSHHVTYNNTFFVLDKPGTNQFYIADGETFDALDFGVAEGTAEPITRHIFNHEELLLFKATDAELWRFTGAADFPYQRDKNASIVRGCQARYSAVNVDSTLYWLGGDDNGQGAVWRLNGYAAEEVTDGAVSYAIQSYGDISDAVAWAYQQEKKTFYVISFPTVSKTWALDVQTGEWHEREYRDPVTSNPQRDRACCHMVYGGEHVVGDWENGNLYALDLDYYTDNGAPMVALRASPHISGEGYNEIRYDEIRLDIENGVGLVTGQGSDPILMLRWSDDGGRTWGPIQNLTMGQIGDFTAECRCTRLGRARDRVFEVSISDPVKRVILGAALKFKDLGR